MSLIRKETAIHSLICFSFHGQLRHLERYLVGNKISLNITTQDLKVSQSRLNKLDICQPEQKLLKLCKVNLFSLVFL